MAAQKSLLSFYEDFLKNYTFVYFPTTNWQRALSPTFNFGCNIQDADVEEHVLSEVGSYGSQINRILDVLSVLVANLDRSALTPQERHFVEKFERLAADADAAAAKYQHKRPHSPIYAQEIDHMIEALISIRRSDRAKYQKLMDQISKQLPPSDQN